MKSLRSFFTLVVLLLVIVFIFIEKPLVSSFFSKTSQTFESIFSAPVSSQNYEELRLENQSLKAEVENLKRSIISDRGEELSAFVYSKYPFAGKENIIINLGEEDGVKTGMPVFTTSNFLVGKIAKVNNFTSEVETIFNPSWRSSSAVGFENQAVLEGGSNPKLDLVSRQASIEAGDEVFSTDSEFPLNSLIGFVETVEDSPSNTWLEIFVEIPYNINELKEVKILTQFP